jgi:hypothetical protein
MQCDNCSDFSPRMAPMKGNLCAFSLLSLVRNGCGLFRCVCDFVLCVHYLTSLNGLILDCIINGNLPVVVVGRGEERRKRFLVIFNHRQDKTIMVMVAVDSHSSQEFVSDAVSHCCRQFW